MTIKVKMNNKTKVKIENNVKISKDLRDKLYAFAIENIQKKGIANFIVDENMQDNEITFQINDTIKTITIK